MPEGSALRTGPSGRTPRSRRRRWLLSAIGILYLVSVPWYRGDDPSPDRWLGLPDWVTVAVLCYAVVAVLNAWAWWSTDIDDAGPLPETLADRDPRSTTREAG